MATFELEAILTVAVPEPRRRCCWRVTTSTSLLRIGTAAAAADAKVRNASASTNNHLNTAANSIISFDIVIIRENTFVCAKQHSRTWLLIGLF